MIYFKTNPDIKIFVEIYNNNLPVQHFHDFIKKDFSNIKKYRFGPIEIWSLMNPNDYLFNLYGKNIFKYIKIQDSDILVRDPKTLYDCKYNYWSSYTSDYWKKKQIERLKILTDIFDKYKIPYWIDGGTLLGAIRNGNLCLFDDDVDIAFFNHNKPIINKIINNYNFKYSNFLPFIVRNATIFKYERNDSDIQKIYIGNRNIRNWDRNLNASYALNTLYSIDTLYYYLHNNSIYISDSYQLKDTCREGQQRKFIAGVNKTIFDNLDTIKLGDYYFNCPKNPEQYVESIQRYGKKSS